MLNTNYLTNIAFWIRTKMNKTKWKSLSNLEWRYSLIIIIYGRSFCSFLGCNINQITVSTHVQILLSRNWPVTGIIWRLQVIWQNRLLSSCSSPDIVGLVPWSLVSVYPTLTEKILNNRQSYFAVHETKRLGDRKWSFWFILNPFYTIFSP